MLNFLSSYFNRRADLSTRFLRINLLAAVALYLLFALLDPIALPINYHKAWCVRSNFAIFIGLMALYSFKKNLPKATHRTLILLTVVIGSAGIFIISLLADAEEYAHLHYINGQVIIILWAMTGFRLQTKDMAILSASILATHTFISISIQGLHAFPVGSYENSAFIGNYLFLTTSSFLGTYGAWRYNNYVDRLKLKREQIRKEKKKLAIAISKAEESERLKSAFLANMSHEIRTPLHAVLGFSQLLRRENLSVEKHQKFVELIEMKGQQLLSLIDNILDLSRIDAQMVELEVKPFSASELFSTLKDQMLNSIVSRHGKQSLDVNFVLQDDSPVIHTDFSRLSLTLFHLLDNAVKFTAKGSVQCEYVYRESMHIFEITDTGCGIDKDHQAFIFERFRQTSNELNRTHGGTGLGLSIVSGLLHLMNGTIDIQSERGAGSTFTISIHDALVDTM